MRIDSAVTFILVLAGLAAPPAISQDAAGLGAPGSRPLITSVSVAEASDRIYVEVAFTELIQPEVSRLEHPDRLVFDFPGCDLSSPGQRFVVNSGSVVAVRTAAVGVESPIARVVIELRSAQTRERATAGTKLVVGLSSTGNNLTIELGASRESPAILLRILLRRAEPAKRRRAARRPLRKLTMNRIEPHPNQQRFCRPYQARLQLCAEQIEPRPKLRR